MWAAWFEHCIHVRTQHRTIEGMGLLQAFSVFLPFFRVMPGQRNGQSSPETYRAWVAKDFASATQGLPLELLGVAPAARQGGLHGLHLWSPAETFLPPWHKLSFQRTRKWTWPWWRQYQNIHLSQISAGNGPQGDFGLFVEIDPLWVSSDANPLVFHCWGSSSYLPAQALLHSRRADLASTTGLCVCNMAKFCFISSMTNNAVLFSGCIGQRERKEFQLLP